MIKANKPETDLDLMFELTREFQDESDRAAAILSAAYLEYLLGELITASMSVEPNKVDELLYRDGHGPLGSFSAKIDTVYCLGLLSDDEYSDLNAIRRIRNDFAHKLVGLSFNYQNIANRCLNLKGAQVGGRPASARECFQKTAIRLMVDVILKTRDKRDQRS